MATKRTKSTPGIALDDAVSELFQFIENATSFVASELEPDWAVAERYYNGYTDLEEFEGRSVVTKTEVRDAIRNTMPSVMRVLTSSNKPIQYIPNSVHHAQWVDQQAQYANALFLKCGGYMTLYSACLEAFKLKNGIIKTWWEEDPDPEFVRFTKVPFSTVEQLTTDPLIEVQDFELSPNEVEDAPDLYDVEFIRFKENGAIRMESIPNYEFFISRNCNSIEDAIERGVHGQQQVVTVAQAISMGLEYDDWLELDAEDPELSDHSESSTERKGFTKTDPNDDESEDVLRHEFLLTEVYIKYDMEDEGRPQLYRFYVGGTSYKYIDHVRVQDSPFSLIQPIPIPNNPYGHSIADLTINEQDTSTSLLRAAVDNAHASNDAKFIGDPNKVDFDDLMNPALNAPVKARNGSQVQIVQTPFTAQGTLSVLQYLDLDVQNKIGITKAAQGLDPDALQSTDKQAVLNTIQTSQGQTELMVRNIIETGLIRAFRLLLRLQIQHAAPLQMMMVKGKPLQIDTRMFDPDAAAIPNVGLGTASPMQRQAAITGVIQRIEAYLEKFGPNNPFTSYAQLYNALEDLLEANSIYNVERYFNIITPQVEAEWAKAEEQKQQALMAQQQENAPMDPSKAFIEVEHLKAEVNKLKIISDNRTQERKLALEATKADEQNNLERDKMIQDRQLKLIDLSAQEEADPIRSEQKENDKSKPISKASEGGGNSPRSKPGLSDGGGAPSSKSPDSSAGGAKPRGAANNS